ncbi:hypothetical protein [Streptomyces laurentii]|uniref:hypothetical protein n=1 Tax=Streptomyces laurentii TaxID=39478 RepID=UPI0033F6FF8E
MSGLTLAGMSAPLNALQEAAGRFPRLPAPTVSISTVCPDQLDLSFHSDVFSAAESFAAFEAWREALGLDPMSVVHCVHADGRTEVLRVHGGFAGADVRLVAFAPVPALEPVPAGAVVDA